MKILLPSILTLLSFPAFSYMSQDIECENKKMKVLIEPLQGKTTFKSKNADGTFSNLGSIDRRANIGSYWVQLNPNNRVFVAMFYYEKAWFIMSSPQAGREKGDTFKANISTEKPVIGNPQENQVHPLTLSDAIDEAGTDFHCEVK